MKKATKTETVALRKRKFVIWLNNRVDRRDDEWIRVWATSAEEAEKSIEFDESRFTRGRVYAADEFYNVHGFRVK